MKTSSQFFRPLFRHPQLFFGTFLHYVLLGISGGMIDVLAISHYNQSKRYVLRKQQENQLAPIPRLQGSLPIDIIPSFDDRT